MLRLTLSIHALEWYSQVARVVEPKRVRHRPTYGPPQSWNLSATPPHSVLAHHDLLLRFPLATTRRHAHSSWNGKHQYVSAISAR